MADNANLAESLPPPPSRFIAVHHLATIIAPFFASLAELGEFSAVTAEEMPEDYQALLAHDDHMTVTVEAFFGSLVDVRVLAERKETDLYCRTSLLVLQSTGVPVQLGIVRINLTGLSVRVRDEIESGRTPLGRILIRRNVLRRVQLHRLWRIEPGPVLHQHLFASASGESRSGFCREGNVPEPADASPNSGVGTGSSLATVYGRSARIIVENQPTVELLEIVRA